MTLLNFIKTILSTEGAMLTIAERQSEKEFDFVSFVESMVTDYGHTVLLLTQKEHGHKVSDKDILVSLEKELETIFNHTKHIDEVSSMIGVYICLDYLDTLSDFKDFVEELRKRYPLLITKLEVVEWSFNTYLTKDAWGAEVLKTLLNEKPHHKYISASEELPEEFAKDVQKFYNNQPHPLKWDSENNTIITENKGNSFLRGQSDCICLVKRLSVNDLPMSGLAQILPGWEQVKPSEPDLMWEQNLIGDNDSNLLPETKVQLVSKSKKYKKRIVPASTSFSHNTPFSKSIMNHLQQWSNYVADYDNTHTEEFKSDPSCLRGRLGGEEPKVYGPPSRKSRRR